MCVVKFNSSWGWINWLTQKNPGEIENLIRHLVCVDLQTGKVLWQKDVKAALPEDPYSGIGVTAHGYASHTPVSDGQNICAFFGKGGVHALDLDGKELWQARLPGGGQATPMTYRSAKSGRQFGVIAAGGFPLLGAKQSDAIVAYALPEKGK